MSLGSDSAAPPPPRGSAPDRRRAELDRFRRRSRAIHFWRRALPVVIAGIAVVLAAWIGGRSLIIKMTTPPPKPPPSTGLRMVNPRFYGRDKSNGAFVLGASEAARPSSSSKNVTLAAPNLTLGAGGPVSTHVQAQSGVYQEDQRQLTLQGQVQIHSSSGYTFTTPDARVDTTKGTVEGESGIEGKGPLGHIAASSYGVYDRGKRIVMKGRVHAHIVQ